MPKKTSAERFGIMETEIKFIKEEMTEIKSDIKDFINSADTKYAEKRYEEKVDNMSVKLARYTGIAIAAWAIIQIAITQFL